MNLLKNLSIRQKLSRFAMLSSGLALTLAFAAFTIFDWMTAREEIKHELSLVASLVGANSTGALEFEDAKVGRETLETLSKNSKVLAGALFLRTGKVIATYRKENEKRPLPTEPPANGIRFEAGGCLITQPIIYKDQQIGTIFLRASLSEFYDHFFQHGLIAGLLLLGSFILAQLFSAKLKESITSPVFHLAKTAEEVSKWQDYSIRAEKVSEDELGLLTDRFNEMLNRIQEGDRVLRETTVTKDYVENIMNTMADSLIVLSPQGKIQTVNREVSHLLGYEEEELIGQVLDFLFIKKFGDEIVEPAGMLIHEILRQGLVLNRESICLNKWGEEIPVLFSGSFMISRRGKDEAIVCIIKNITERKQAERDLLHAKTEAEIANNAKSDFLSKMSHELRTPMTSILGFGQLMALDKDSLGSKQSERVKRILAAGRHLLKLINEILDLSKIESGEIDISIEPVEVVGVLKELIGLVGPLAAQNNIRLEKRFEGDQKFVSLADRTRLKQALLNFLSNAIKYNSKGGSVIITCEVVPQDRVKISIADTGPGISEEGQKLLFEPFKRLVKDSGGIGGTGIGLTISKKLVELMGGEIGWKSKLGEGTCFWVTLAQTQKLDTQHSLNVEEGSSFVLDRKIGYTILYIEDNPANQDFMEMVFAEWENVNLLSAPEASLGLELAQAHKPNLILMDVNLPGMNGVEAMIRLKDSTDTCHIPVVALSANAYKKDIKKALAAGFDDYLVKPLELQEFGKIVTKYLRD